MPNRMDGHRAPLLEVHGLKTYFDTETGLARAVDGLDFSLARGGAMGIVGESGCGKSVTSLSIMRLVPSPGRITAGRILFEGEDLASKPEYEMRKIRGKEISMIFQEPMTSLNPVYTVGFQIMEAITYHQRLDARAARAAAIEMLHLVGIPSPETRVDEYPHQMSGGMRQRVMIAMALSCRPKLLIADEPTTALDVTIQAQILDLMRRLRNETGTAIMLITHDMGVIAEMAETVAVMYAGRIVELAGVGSLFSQPRHPYTWGLLMSIPKLNESRARLHTIEGVVPNATGLPEGCRFAPRCEWAKEICRLQDPPLIEVATGHCAACWALSGYREQPAVFQALDFASSTPPAKERHDASRIAAQPIIETKNDGEATGRRELLRVDDLAKYFPVAKRFLSQGGGLVKAVDGISFSIERGETLALVGESGCGKTTTGWLILRLIEPTKGRVFFENQNLFALGREELRRKRREMQIIFQDPYSSLNPRMTVGEIIAQPMIIHGLLSRPDREQRVAELLDVVGLAKENAQRYPHELSGGQRQRIGVARALALSPKLIICDEPVSALDVSIQAQVINLLQDLQKEFALTYLFISHDLSVVKHISSRVGVMYLGKMVELAAKDSIFGEPLHPYTQALLAAIPLPDPGAKRDRIILQGDVPSPVAPPAGCRFHTRCPSAMEICRHLEPPTVQARPGHWVACHLVKEPAAEASA